MFGGHVVQGLTEPFPVVRGGQYVQHSQAGLESDLAEQGDVLPVSVGVATVGSERGCFNDERAEDVGTADVPGPVTELDWQAFGANECLIAAVDGKATFSCGGGGLLSLPVQPFG